MKTKKLPSATVRRRRILEAAKRGASGRFWYDDAQKEIRTVARAWGVDPISVAAAVAATSPATPVIASPRMKHGGGSASNIGKARRVVKAISQGRGGLSAVHPKMPGVTRLTAFENCRIGGDPLQRCLETAFPSPSDTKTHAFVRNLLGDRQAVTVDTLIGRGAGIPPNKSGGIQVSKARYRLIAADIRAVAKQLGWAPAEVMAAAWTGWGGTGGLTLATRKERKTQGRTVRTNGRVGGRSAKGLTGKPLAALMGAVQIIESSPNDSAREQRVVAKALGISDLSQYYSHTYGDFDIQAMVGDLGIVKEYSAWAWGLRSNGGKRAKARARSAKASHPVKRYIRRNGTRAALVQHMVKCGWDRETAERMAPRTERQDSTRRALTPQELAAFEREVRRSVEDPAIRTILRLLPLTGMRVNEACTMPLRTVQTAGRKGNLSAVVLGKAKGGRPKIGASGKGPNGERIVHDAKAKVINGRNIGRMVDRHGNPVKAPPQKRSVPLGRHGTALVQSYLSSRPRSSLDRVFVGPKGGKITPAMIQKACKEVVRRAGLSPKITPHFLRHAYVSQAIAKCWDPQRVREIIGHGKKDPVTGKSVGRGRLPAVTLLYIDDKALRR